MKSLYRFVSIALIIVLVISFAACAGKPQEQAHVTDTPEYTDDSVAESSGSGQQYVEVNREGTVDQIPVEIIDGICLDYTIAMDPEYFTFSSDGQYDTFSYEAWGNEPRVYYCIYPYYDITAQELAAGLVHMYGGNYADNVTEQVMVGDYAATAVYFSDDVNFPGCQMHFYLIETSYGCVVIETQFVLEMYEGLYAIMRACFDTFTLQNDIQ